MNELNRHQSGIREVAFGKEVTLVEPVNLYECQLGDEVFVGPLWKFRKE